MTNYYQHNGTSYVHVSDYEALVKQLAAVEWERNALANNAATRSELLEMLDDTSAALRFWLPDRTMVEPELEMTWERHLRLLELIDAVLERQP